MRYLPTILLLASLCAACGHAPEQHKQPTRPDGSILPQSENGVPELKDNTISAEQLLATYEQNEVRADNLFKGHEFCVEGVVSDIKKDMTDNIYVALEAGQPLRRVQCYLPNQRAASLLDRGMTAKFKGTCGGLMGNVLMRDCLLLETIDSAGQ